MTPLLSICIPTRDRPHQLRQILLALQAQTDGPSVEVIVANNGGTLPHDLPNFARIVVSPPGAPHARNAAAQAARGEVLAFLDDDCLPGDTYLTALLQRTSALFRESVSGLAGGVRRVVSAHALDVAWRQAGFDRYFDYSQSHPTLNWYPTANLIVRRDLFFAAGRFREDIPGRVGGEDIEFCLRLMDYTGHSLQCAPNIEVTHASVENSGLWPLVRKAFWYGQSERWLVRVRPSLHTSFWQRGRFWALHRDWRAATLTLALVLGNLYESLRHGELPASISLSRSAGL